MTIFLMEDKAEVQGTKVSLKTTSAGHYILPLLNHECMLIDEVFSVNLQKASFDEKKAALIKLHKQFGHRPKEAFIQLLKNANTWSIDMSKIMDSIIENCAGCIMRRRNPDRPAVALQMANDFNEKVAYIRKGVGSKEGTIQYFVWTYDYGAPTGD